MQDGTKHWGIELAIPGSFQSRSRRGFDTRANSNNAVPFPVLSPAPSALTPSALTPIQLTRGIHG